MSLWAAACMFCITVLLAIVTVAFFLADQDSTKWLVLAATVICALDFARRWRGLIRAAEVELADPAQ